MLRCIALIVWTGLLFGQVPLELELANPAQARSQEELDDYLVIVTNDEPESRVQSAKRFVSAYPASEFLPKVYGYQMRAFQEMGNPAAALLAAEALLALTPDDLGTLLVAARMLTRNDRGSAGFQEDLEQATRYATRALKTLERMLAPREIPLRQWQAARAEMEAQAHETLGHAAVQQGRVEEAITAFEVAALQSPVPNGGRFLYFGMACALAGRLHQAETALRKAEEIGPDEVRALARAEIKRLEEKTPR